MLIKYKQNMTKYFVIFMFLQEINYSIGLKKSFLHVFKNLKCYTEFKNQTVKGGTRADY